MTRGSWVRHALDTRHFDGRRASWYGRGRGARGLRFRQTLGRSPDNIVLELELWVETGSQGVPRGR